MSKPWVAEFWRYLLLMVVSLFVGELFGSLAFGLFLGSTVYLGWNLYNLHRLDRWLERGRKLQPPEAPGLWGEIFHHLYQLQKRNRSRKRKLKAYLKRFRESTAVTPDATVVLGGQGEILWWNEAATRLLGLRNPHDVGQRLINLIRTPVFTEFCARGDYEQTVDFPSPLDAATQLSVRIVPYGKNQRLVVARDVTRLHRLEQMRRDFVANVSHELRTPLTVIHGFLETMQDADDECSKRWNRSLALMSQQSRRMELIVEDLLMLSRLETEERPPHVTPVKVAALIEEIAGEARALSGEREHRIVVEADTALNLEGSAKELRSAFSNLIFNAVQYTPEKRGITLRWGRDDEGPRFQVEDEGEGIAPQHIPRLTERFYRVDVGRSRERGGTGLGLAIVKHVLTRHGGHLEIDSVVGEGSTFICRFPDLPSPPGHP